MSQPLKIYTAYVCPWAQRATLALKEVGADAEWVAIDLKNKPSWYASKVNPASKVPVLQIGADDSPDKKLLPESGIITEYVLEAYNKFLPADPYAKAESRYFADRFIQVLSSPFTSALFQNKPELVGPGLLNGAREIQGLLAKHKGPYILGDEYSVGDILVAPFVVRLFTFLKNFTHHFDKDTLTTLASGEEFKPLQDYHNALLARPAVKDTYFEKDVLAFVNSKI